MPRPPVEALVYSAIALLILGPLLLPGYVLTLDMVFTPELRPARSVANSYLFWTIMHWADIVLPAQLIQKVLLFAIMALAGLGMHRLVESFMGKSQGLTIYFAGILYMINPFTYDRLITGQYLVLFGYALLPWLTHSLLGFIRQPGAKNILKVAAWAIAISIVSIHTIAIGLIVALLLLALQLWRSRDNLRQAGKLLRGSVLVALVWLVASSYWLIPSILGKSQQVQYIWNMTTGDRSAFATTGANTLERIGNVLGLQGFWAESRGLFILPQHVTPEWLWTILILFLIGLVITGGVVWWRQRMRGELAVFGGCIVIGAVLAAGIGGEWMAAHIPFFAGYREPQKFAALVALGYCVLAPVGLAAMLRAMERRKLLKAWAGVVAGLMLALPFVLTPTMAWAAMGQLKSSHYPDNWYTVNDQLNADTDEFKTLFLPWHLYMHMDFAGRVIANPARNFFDKPVIISDDPELEGAALDRSSPATRQIDSLLKREMADKADDADSRAGDDKFAAELAKLDVKYVILAKDNDYEDYGFLDKRSGLRKIADYETISLYRNERYRP